jgi:ribosomal protein S18 acetylase RimI-like enzyme
MKLRVMHLDDIPAAMRLKDLSGWNQTRADWERFLAASPDGCFVAEFQGRVVGTSATIVYEGRFAWIGMVVVDPELRGNGMGTALLKLAIEYLDARKVPCMKLDATPQGKILYEKYGFVGEYEIERWLLARETPAKGPERVSNAMEDVLSVDREIFGADRSMLLRAIGNGAPEFPLVVREGSEITGFAFGRRGTIADHLGPWMARSRDAAERLLDEFLNVSDRDRIFVDCLCSNPWAVPLVKERGFELSRPLTRMFRGRNEYPGQHGYLCAILGPEFG